MIKSPCLWTLWFEANRGKDIPVGDFNIFEWAWRHRPDAFALVMAEMHQVLS